MNKPIPKFCVGEEVKVISWTGRVMERIEIIKHKYVENHGMYTDRPENTHVYTGWLYSLCGDHEKFAEEDQLRKLPPEERTSWEDCAFKPKEILEEA